VRDVLEVKCALCHGPELAHPKGDLGYITDLPRLASDRDHVIPGDPAGSFLWNQIDSGDMPPEESKAGPLSAGEKQVIHDWIQSGAPSPDAQPPTRDDRGPQPEAPNGRTVLSRLAVLAGRFHILTIHFPIALLAAASMAELGCIFLRRPAPLRTVNFCLALGAAAAVLSAALGWLHASYHPGEPADLLAWHRWLGTAVGIMAPTVAFAAARDARAGARRVWIRWSIVALGILAGAAGHFGGLLVHGRNFLSF
jgi:hypothetical protein